MKVAIIYPPFSEDQPKNRVKVRQVAQNYGIVPSLSLGYIAAIVENSGNTVFYIDANALVINLEEVVRRVKIFNPDLIAFTITTPLFHQCVDYIKEVKSKLNIPVIIGGVHLSLYPKETFSYDCFDFGIIGEAELSLPKFLKAFEKGKGYSSVKGLIYRKDGKVIINLPETLFEDFNITPFPARHLMPNGKYYSLISSRKNFTMLLSSKGCPFRCIYCDQGHKKFRPRSAKSVVDEMEECYRKFKIREIDIVDSSFTIDKQRVLAICDEIINRKLDISWYVRSRTDRVDKEMLSALKKAGCIRIYYGIESGNSNVLMKLRKETNLHKIKEVIDWTNSSGIESLGYFMIGCPGDTRETIKQTISFACSLSLDYAMFSPVSPLPGSEMYDVMLKPLLKEDYWSHYILDRNYDHDLPVPECNLSKDEILKWTREAYIKFYFRPSYLFKQLIKIKSFSQLKRYSKFALQILLQRS